ncbi:fatty acyl-CoA reductase [Caerostris extrusa]|uniref:Fatty acyl-CoA reductase n=1 Tax=Caerostris extrusa TaxID=172846 RepID=A0AAV4Q6S5_CAEEX|nr:fatty acyl-CoA reductase [Caerostris extrusa]
MSELVENKNDSVRISKFMRASRFSLLSSWFVGVVLLEILLRCCGGIKSIYILLREKKDKYMLRLFHLTQLFRQLREEDPKVFDKVHVVAGDLSLTDMDMSQHDLKRVVEEVSIVFHCAASVSFFKPLQYLLLHNAGGVNNIISLCKKLKRCEVLVFFTSTAYSNCNRKLKIEEKVYRLPYEAQRFIDAVDNGKEDLLQQIVSNANLGGRILLLQQVRSGEPPSSRKHRTSRRPSFDLRSSDPYGKEHCRHASPFVVNCSSHGSYEYRIGEHIHVITEVSMKNTIPHTFRYSNKCWVDNHPVKTKLLSLFEHYIPAVGLDLMLLLQGKRPRLVSLYRFLDRVVKISTYFICNSWIYESGTFGEGTPYVPISNDSLTFSEICSKIKLQNQQLWEIFFRLTPGIIGSSLVVPLPLRLIESSRLPIVSLQVDTSCASLLIRRKTTFRSCTNCDSEKASPKHLLNCAGPHHQPSTCL